jgi:hypothetical protein
MWVKGQIIKPSPANETGYVYQARNAGQSSSTEPTAWPTTINDTIQDGPIASGVTWVCLDTQALWKAIGTIAS